MQNKIKMRLESLKIFRLKWNLCSYHCGVYMSIYERQIKCQNKMEKSC